MDVKKVGKNIVSKLQENLRPISTHISKVKSKKQESQIISDIPNRMQRINIDSVFEMIKQNSNLDYKITVSIVTCLKLSQQLWRSFIEDPNKNGELASKCEQKLKRIQSKFGEITDALVVTGDLQKIRMAQLFLKPHLQYLEKKSRKYREHQNQFQSIHKKLRTQQKEESYEKDDQIKDQMLDLVQKFKKYALNINENLEKDTTIIEQINTSQDKQLQSLGSKNKSMKKIIEQQKLGFFRLLGMAAVGVVLWVVCLMFIIII